MDNNKILIEKLDEFIRKYYKNKLIQGLLLSVASLLFFYLILNVIEYYYYSPPIARAFLFWTYIITAVLIVMKFIIIPIARIFKLGKLIDYNTAAKIIGVHFIEINDILVNTLQLTEMSKELKGNRDLILASIQQKIDKIKPIPFTAAIDIKKNVKYLKYAIPPILIFFVIMIAYPKMITEPSERYVKFNKYYSKPAPFTFNILNKKLQTPQLADFILNVKLVGDEIPDEVFIVYNGIKRKLEQKNTVCFDYEFRNVRKNTKFILQAGEFQSEEYELVVIAKPTITDFNIDLIYPPYINKSDETLQNTGDIVIPQGTTVAWRIRTRDASNVLFKVYEKILLQNPVADNLFIFQNRFMKSGNYVISARNPSVNFVDSVNYIVTVIPDEYPQISVEQYKDTLYDKIIYFSGDIKDDYGFKKLTFNFQKLNSENKSIANDSTIILPFNKGSNHQKFNYFFDLRNIQVNPGDTYEYYFEIWDNDGVNGSKSTKSQKKIYRVPTLEELEKYNEEKRQEMESMFEQAIKDASELKKEIDEISKELQDKKSLSWEERDKIQKMLDEQLKLQNTIEKLQLMNKEKSIKENQFNKLDESILEKQKQLQKLFDELMTDEMKELFRQMQELVDKVDKKQMESMLDKLKMSNEEIEKQLDRDLELFKRLEFEKEFDKTIEEVKKLADEQKKLAEKTDNKENDLEEIKQEQDSLNNKFQKISEKIDSLQKMNSELDKPNELKSTDAKENEIKNSMQKSSNSLENENRNKSKESQEEASEKLEELSDELSDMKDQMEQENTGEDIETLRQILENLIKTSFDQEALSEKTRKINIKDPGYVKIMDDQKKINDNILVIKDSINALSKRQPMIGNYVEKEISNIDYNIKNILTLLQNRNVSVVANQQQQVMTSINNLALLLSEVMEQMLEQKKSQCKSGKNCKSGKCKKPGSGTPDAKTMKQLQEQLNKKIESLKKQMEGMKPGQANGMKPINEQLARLAAEQEAIRKMLKEYGEEDKRNGGKNSAEINDMMMNMEQTEQDLVNKIINDETLKRQNEILTRLLESEKAEKEREMDEKRESEEAKFYENSNPNEFFKYKDIKEKEIEMLKSMPPQLKSFYKRKVNEYFYNFAE